MKRYLIFGGIGPFIGGFLMLLATTVASGYWTDTNWTELGKFLGAFFKTLQYSYLFGIVPALMVGDGQDLPKTASIASRSSAPTPAAI
jgi:hypothetical protein